MAKARYREIVQAIESRIASGELRPGDRIESIREICDGYGVSSIVALRVFRELGEAGLAERRDGAGYFVSERTEGRGGRNTIVCLFRPLRDASENDNFGNRIIFGIMNEALANHLHIVFPESSMMLRSRVPAEEEVRRMGEELAGFSNVAGVIADMRLSDEMLRRHILPAAGHAPLATVGRGTNLPGVFASELPMAECGRDAAKLALKSGASYFVHCSDHSLADSTRFTQGFLNEIKDSATADRVRCIDGLCAIGPERDAEFADGLADLIGRDRTRRVFISCGVDSIARNLCNLLSDRNLAAGKDYGLMGFGGYDMARNFTPRIATAEVDVPALGANAVSLVLQNREFGLRKVARYTLELNETL